MAAPLYLFSMDVVVAGRRGAVLTLRCLADFMPRSINPSVKQRHKLYSQGNRKWSLRVTKASPTLGWARSVTRALLTLGGCFDFMLRSISHAAT